jgi:conjugative relaxase-like TrwC/TraI family protein
MTLHKLHAGDGYTYLTRQVAAGDEGRSAGQALADYYTASGNPPGRWMCSGAADLAVSGRVREDQMRALFGRGMHPDAEQIITLELAAGRTQRQARRAAKLGRAFDRFQRLEPRAERVAARLAAFEAEHGRPAGKVERSKIEAAEARRERRPVAGYDLVFTPVKSASLLWALGDAGTREAVEAAHHEAAAQTLGWLERETAFTRTGSDGEAQIDTRGFIAACFDHRDSRAGDPDLHTHVAISNKVRALHDHPDGTPRWLALDARPLHAAAVAASERYNTRFEDALARRLGVRFVERADTLRPDKRSIREIAGVPDQLIRHFSKRRGAIEDRYRELAADYRTSHGHEPPRTAQLKLTQQATLETRDAKDTGSSLADKITVWRTEAETVIGRRALTGLMPAATGRTPALVSPDQIPLDHVTAAVLTAVAEQKATWTTWNLLAETERQLRPYRFASPTDRDTATELVLARVTDPHLAVNLTPEPALAPEPALCRASGESVLTEHGAARYTTQRILDAEQHLLDAAQQSTRYSLSPAAVNRVVAAFEEREHVSLDDGQWALVHGFTADQRRLVVGIGPAGAGKTTAMRAVTEAWASTGRRVVPLAPSAAAADVLGTELGVRAENLHKFQHAHTGDTPSTDPWFRLQPGDLVLVDEAGMAGTLRLDWLTRYARERGAVVRLLGDPAQLSAVEAGGALRLLVNDVGAIELDRLHRFHHPAEAEATLKLRNGDSTGLDFYFANDRVTTGSNDAMLEAAYEAWASDTRNGHTSLLIAATNQDVTALNTRARLERIHTGQVEPDGVDLRDGTRAGVGDWIVTRTNRRDLPIAGGRDFVKNGDTWTVQQRHTNGDLTVCSTTCGGVGRLPADYVSTAVVLAYAATTARIQGRTVDSAHVLVDDSMTRESLYVATTRGRSGAYLYAATDTLAIALTERAPAPGRSARIVLEDALRRESGERSATEVQRVASRHITGSPEAPRQLARPRPKPAIAYPERQPNPEGLHAGRRAAGCSTGG